MIYISGLLRIGSCIILINISLSALIYKHDPI